MSIRAKAAYVSKRIDRPNTQQRNRFVRQDLDTESPLHHDVIGELLVDLRHKEESRLLYEVRRDVGLQAQSGPWSDIREEG